MSSKISGRATVLAATVSSGKWFQSGTNRYNFVLDVRPGDGSPTFRTQLSNVRIYQAKPAAGIDVAVEVESGTREVTLLWKGDPNLDMDAWRAQRDGAAQDELRRAMDGEGPA